MKSREKTLSAARSAAGGSGMAFALLYISEEMGYDFYPNA